VSENFMEKFSNSKARVFETQEAPSSTYDIQRKRNLFVKQSRLKGYNPISNVLTKFEE